MSLELRRVGHAYGPRSGPVLRGVDLRIEPGTVQAIVGPSGSGKTTLLSILGLLTRPAEGEVLVDGQPVWRHGRSVVALRAQLFGWVFQTVNVLSRRTVLDNASLGLRARGARGGPAAAAAMDALLAVGLGPMAYRPANTLSGGELQRLCIAGAIAMRPSFLLADEPTGQLDRSTTEEVIEAMMAARSPETAIVIVTHDQLVASRCDIVYGIDDGVVSRREAVRA